MRAGDLQAAAAAAERRLDGDGKAVLLGERDDLVGVLDRLRRAGHQRRVGPRAMCRAVTLSPRSRMDCGLGPDPGQPGVDDRLREIGVLGKESVAGVDRVGAGLAAASRIFSMRGRTRRRLAAEREGLVGEPHVRRVAVGVGVDGHAGQPGVPAARMTRTAISPRLAISTLEIFELA